jgi:hypothetical protein
MKNNIFSAHFLNCKYTFVKSIISVTWEQSNPIDKPNIKWKKYKETIAHDENTRLIMFLY